MRIVQVLIRATLAMLASVVTQQAAAQAVTTVVSAATDQCLEVYSASLDNGAAVIQFPCKGATNQQWRLNAAGGYVGFSALHSGQCIDVYGASTAADAQAIQWPCRGAVNQQFALRPQGSGYALVAAHSNLCLGVEGESREAAARITQQACNGSAFQTWRVPGLANRGAAGEWSQPQTLSLVPVAAANLPDGRVLMWSAYQRFMFGDDNGRTYTLVYDPLTGGSSEVLVSNTGHDMFCPGTANLADGRVHVTGGSSSSKTSIYDPASGTWTTSSAMGTSRGYHAAVSLSNRDVFVIGGSWSGAVGNKNGEVWSATGGQWRPIDTILDDYMITADRAGLYRADNHAWLFAAAGGRVFHAGPSKRMNWFDTNAGTASYAGDRGTDGDAMNGNATMFATNRILTLGGAPNYSDDNATSNAHVIDIAANPVNVRKVSPMAYARAYATSVVLPDGQVLVVGGQSYAVPFTDDRSVFVPEMWNPATERFTSMASMAVPRNYHSVALLLPDGRVLSGGGGLCGAACTTNHPDVQIFSPPYLFTADGTPAARPMLTNAPSTASSGTRVAVTTDRPVSTFSVVRLSSVTHTVNNEQRRVALRATQTGTNQYSLALPSSRGTLVPGYYMLFAMDANGVPSVSRTIRIQ
jgi:galactose oxidase